VQETGFAVPPLGCRDATQASQALLRLEDLCFVLFNTDFKRYWNRGPKAQSFSVIQ